LATLAKPCQRQFSKAYPLVTHTASEKKTQTAGKCNSFPLSAFLIFITICLIFAFSYGSYFALPHSPHKSLSISPSPGAACISQRLSSRVTQPNFLSSPIHHQLGIYTEEKLL